MSEHIMENLTICPLNDVSEKLSKRANENEIRNGTLSALTERCNRIEAENAKLIVKLNAEHIARQNVEVDNANLRELVNDMWICIAHGSEGWDCTGCRRDPDNVCIMGISEFSDRMRELGIEVRHV